MTAWSSAPGTTYRCCGKARRAMPNAAPYCRSGARATHPPRREPTASGAPGLRQGLDPEGGIIGHQAVDARRQVRLHLGHGGSRLT